MNTSTESIIKINDVDIHIITLNNEIWIKANDICNFIGYANIKRTIRQGISPSNIKMQQELIICSSLKNAQKHTKYINKNGLEELIIKSKKIPTIINELAKVFDIKINNFNPLYKTKVLSKEQVTVDSILKVFKNEKYKLQHSVGIYHIDLYFIDHKLAIECDEFNHKDRNHLYEKTRQEF